MTFERKSAVEYLRRDASFEDIVTKHLGVIKGDRITTTTTVRYTKRELAFNRPTRLDIGKERIVIPNIHPISRGRPKLSKTSGSGKKERVPDRFEERLRKFELFGEKTYDFAVRIGITDPNAQHIGYNGRPVDYSALFAYLYALGFDPLAPLRDQSIVSNLEHHLAHVIYKTISEWKSSGASHDTVTRHVESWARNIRDLVRDYIRGSISITPKADVSDSTVETRNSRLNSNGSLYKYGTANALWETGTLEKDITFKVIPLNKLTLFKKERDELKKELERRRRNISKKDAEDVVESGMRSYEETRVIVEREEALARLKGQQMTYRGQRLMLLKAEREGLWENVLRPLAKQRNLGRAGLVEYLKSLKLRKDSKLAPLDAMERIALESAERASEITSIIGD